MNLTILGALFEDARQQVLDNKVFRLLIILTAIPILFTFLIGFHPEHISILWGWKEINYVEFMESFSDGGSASGPAMEEIDMLFIQGVQALFVDYFVGMFGMMFCIAATAFFAPRILEKGAADTLFSKPVSRMTILMSRYFAGILFVAFLSIVLVVGMYLGFLTTSGYNDPGFLWGALTLTYLYAMMHAFSIAIAVFTRSSIAAILLTIFLFMICGAVHPGWVTYEYFEQKDAAAAVGTQEEESPGQAEEGEATSDKKERSAFVGVLLNTLQGLHYVLPKTSDADMITAKLKRALTESNPQVETKDGDLLVKLAPEGFELAPGSDTSLESKGVEWKPAESDGAERSRISLRRFEREKTEKMVGSRMRIQMASSSSVARKFEDELEEQGLTPTSDNIRLGGTSGTSIQWSEDDGSLLRDRIYLHYRDWMYEFDFSIDSEQPNINDLDQIRRELGRDGNMVFGQIAGMSPETWYQKKFDWNAEWKYNIFFSLGSSIAFIVAMLTLAWARLRKIDF